LTCVLKQRLRGINKLSIDYYCQPGRLFLYYLVFIAGLTSCVPSVTSTGKASYYADKFNGKKTASGEVYRSGKKTAAHKTLPFGTKVKVTNVKNGKTVKVRINDRGPHTPGRIIDLSKSAAKKVGLVEAGVAEVRIRYKSGK
jgi:rare lipoprotein A